MWTTSDGYRLRMPQFRARRLARRLRHRGRGRLLARESVRALGLVLGRARRALAHSGAASTHPVFRSHLGGDRVVIFTRRVSPRELELLYVQRLRAR